jgi:hypothetical protein
MPSWDVHGMTIVESIFSGVTIACLESHDWNVRATHIRLTILLRLSIIGIVKIGWI